MKELALLAFSIMTYGIPALLLVLHLLHFTLPKRLDNTWFKAPFFSDAERAIYSSYPLSLFKTIAYTCAVGLPVVVKKRFIDLSPASSLNILFKLASYLFFVLVLLGVIMVLIFLTAAIVL